MELPVMTFRHLCLDPCVQKDIVLIAGLLSTTDLFFNSYSAENTSHQLHVTKEEKANWFPPVIKGTLHLNSSPYRKRRNVLPYKPGHPEQI